MNAIARIEGRLVSTKLSAIPLCTSERHDHLIDAERGSRMLRDAIFRAAGYHVPEPVKNAPAPPKPAPTFRPRKVRPIGRPKGDRKFRRINPKIIRIQGLISRHFKVDVETMVLPGKAHARPRQVAMYLARKTTAASLTDIGFHFGDRDHTTVIHAVRTIAEKAGGGDPKIIAALHAAYEGGIR